MAEDRSTKAYKGLSQKETREKLIRDRAARLARDAAKQGITPAQLAKKKRDTYVKVVGGAASLLPIGKIISLAGKGVKALTAGAKTTKAATKTTKAASKAKAATKKPAAKKQTAAKKPAAKPTSKAAQKTAAAKRTITKAEAAGRAVAAGAARTKGAATSAASKTRAAANRLKSRATAAAKKPGAGQRARDALLGGAATSLALNVIDQSRKSGKSEASTRKATVTGPKSRPKRRTGMSEGNTVAGSSGRNPRTRNAPNVGLGKMPKKKVPSTKSRDKDGQGTGKINLPAGAKRKFQGSYNSKKEKLRNIGGKTYVFNK
tara:strand:- start:610 stop:1563 length:954 start_codon:yes stop_codon:yes gene_type:complete